MSSSLPSPNASNGDWFYNNETKTLTYIVSGKGGLGVGATNIDIGMHVSSLVIVYFQCFKVNLVTFCVKELSLEMRKT